MCSIAVASGVIGIAPAAAKPAVLPAQREAETLGRLIRSDARRGGAAATTLVRARKECCGLWLVNVYYRAKLGPEEPAAERRQSLGRDPAA